MQHSDNSKTRRRDSSLKDMLNPRICSGIEYRENPEDLQIRSSKIS